LHYPFLQTIQSDEMPENGHLQLRFLPRQAQFIPLALQIAKLLLAELQFPAVTIALIVLTWAEGEQPPEQVEIQNEHGKLRRDPGRQPENHVKRWRLSAHAELRASRPDYFVSTLIDYAPEARTFANQTGHPALREPVSAIKGLHTDCLHGSLHLFGDSAA
jgi:hypothetical protein